MDGESGVDLSSSAPVSSESVQKNESESGLAAIEQTIQSIEAIEVIQETFVDSSSVSHDDKDGNGFSPADTKGVKNLKVQNLKKKLPMPKVMIRKIQTHLNKDINHLLHKARSQYTRNITKGMAYDLSLAVANVRKMRLTISKLFYATVSYVKALYLKLFKKT